ncbi:MAG: N-formylglutamate amidohydrolase [Desulfovibrionaceae bacterium]
MSASTLLISCEHGGNAIPPVLAPLFRDWRDLLASHRGFDLGALATARVLAQATDAPLFPAMVSRLVVDLNRSIGHSNLFSEITKPLPRAKRQELLDSYYFPHREAVTRAVAERLAAGETVLHLASHSFTPCLGGVARRCDVGLLYDPRRPAEKTFCLDFQRQLARLDRAVLLRRNYPYRGVADGLVTALRKRFGERYLGVELEVNQRFAYAGEAHLSRLNTLLVAALTRALV